MIIVYIIVGLLIVCAAIAAFTLFAWLLQYVVVLIPLLVLIIFVIKKVRDKKTARENSRYSETLIDDNWSESSAFQMPCCNSLSGDYINNESKLITEAYNTRVEQINQIMLMQDHYSNLSQNQYELVRLGYPEKADLLNDSVQSLQKELNMSLKKYKSSYKYITPSFGSLLRNTDNLSPLFKEFCAELNRISHLVNSIHTQEESGLMQLFSFLFGESNATLLCRNHYCVNLLPEYAVIKDSSSSPFVCVPYTKDMISISWDKQQIEYDPAVHDRRHGVIYDDYLHLNTKKNKEGRRERNNTFKDNNPLIQRIDFIDLRFTYQDIDIEIPIANPELGFEESHRLGHAIEDAWARFIGSYNRYYDYINSAISDDGIDYGIYNTFDDYIDEVNNRDLARAQTDKYAVIRNGELIQWNGKGSVAQLILNNVNAIGSAFKDNNHIEHISIEGPVTRIGRDAFKNCKALKTIQLPDSISIIEDGAFENCTNLNSSLSNLQLSSIGENAFRNCESLSTVHLSKDTSLGSYAFEGCSSLVDVIGIDYDLLPTKAAFLGTPWLRDHAAEDFIVDDGTLICYTGSDHNVSIPCG